MSRRRQKQYSMLLQCSKEHACALNFKEQTNSTKKAQCVPALSRCPNCFVSHFYCNSHLAFFCCSAPTRQRAKSILSTHHTRTLRYSSDHPSIFLSLFRFSFFRLPQQKKGEKRRTGTALFQRLQVKVKNNKPQIYTLPRGTRLFPPTTMAMVFYIFISYRRPRSHHRTYFWD